mgnify:CR=1 FL=1
MSEELKPCPFCGCHDRRVNVRKMGAKGYKIICGKCGSAGPYVKIEDFANKMDAQEEAKEAWNRRVPIAYDPDKVVEQLENERKFWENAYDSNLGKEKARSYEHAIEIVKGGGADA